MKEKLRKICFVLSIIIFLTSIGIIIWYYSNTIKEKKAVGELKDLIEEDDTTETANKQTEDKGLEYYIIDGVVVQKKFKEIYLKNKDFVGWIESTNSHIDYPVVYTPDDIDYYLRRNFDKEYNIAGTLLVGANTLVEKPSENVIIYGHNMNDKSMFHDILNYENANYYTSHKYIEFDTLTRKGKYEVIAAFRTEAHAEEEKYEGFNVYDKVNLSKDEFNKFIADCIDKTPYATNSKDITYGDKLITLSTCAYHTENGRYVVIAKLINEKTVDLSKEPIEIITTTTEEQK